MTSFLAALPVAPAVVLEVPLAVQVALVTFLVASAAVLLVALAVPVPVLLEVLEDSVTFLVDLVVGLVVVAKVATPLLPPLLLPLAQCRLLQLVLLMAKLELPVPLVLQTVRLVLELREQLVSMVLVPPTTVLQQRVETLPSTARANLSDPQVRVSFSKVVLLAKISRALDKLNKVPARPSRARVNFSKVLAKLSRVPVKPSKVQASFSKVLVRLTARVLQQVKPLV